MDKKFFLLCFSAACYWLETAITAKAATIREGFYLSHPPNLIRYSATHDCDDVAYNACLQFDKSHCRVLALFKHQANVFRFPQGSPKVPYIINKKYLYCIGDVRYSTTSKCWESDGENFLPPETVFCETYPQLCTKKLKISLWPYAILNERRLDLIAGESAWWANPYKNVGALVDICDQYNNRQNRGSYDFESAMPKCQELEPKECMANSASSCKEKVPPEPGDYCRVLQCQKRKWVRVDWHNVELDNCIQVSARGCDSGFFQSRWRSENDIRYCRTASTKAPHFYVMAYYCKRGQMIRANESLDPFIPEKEAHEVHQDPANRDALFGK